MLVIIVVVDKKKNTWGKWRAYMLFVRSNPAGVY
jgi:hypothetical protein